MSINIASNFNLFAGLPLDARGVVADITARNAIAAGQRYDGMIVYVVASNDTYQLQGGITNTDWVVWGGGTIYAFLNGLTDTAGTVRLGGALTGSTTITTSGNELWINSSIAIGSNTDADNTLITIKNGAVGTVPALQWKANYIGTTQDALVMSGPLNVGMNLSVYSEGREANLEAMNDTLNYGCGLTLGLRGGSVATSVWWRLFRDTTVNNNQFIMSFHNGPSSIDNNVYVFQVEGDSIQTVSKDIGSLTAHHLSVTSNALIAGSGTLIGQKITLDVPTTCHDYVTGLDIDIQMQATHAGALNDIYGVHVHNQDSAAYYHGGRAFSAEGAWQYGIYLKSSVEENGARIFDGDFTQEKDDSSIYGTDISLTDATTGTGVSFMMGHNLNFTMRAGATQTVRAIAINNNNVAAATTSAVFYVNGTWDYAFQLVGTFGSIFNIGINAVPAGYALEALATTGGGIKLWNTASASGNYYGLWVKNGSAFNAASLDGSGGAIYANASSANGVALILETDSGAGDSYLVYGKAAMHGMYIKSWKSYASQFEATGTILTDQYVSKIVTDYTAGINNVRGDGLIIEHSFDHDVYSGTNAAALVVNLTAFSDSSHHILLKGNLVSGTYRTGLMTLESYDNVNDQPFCIFRGFVTATQNILYFGGGITGNADVATDIIYTLAPAVGTSEISGTIKQMASITSATFNHDRAMSLGSEWTQSVVSTGDTLPHEYSYIRVGGNGAAATLGNGSLAIATVSATRGQILVICGTDDTYPVTIKDTSAGSGVSLAGGTDAVLSAGDTLVVIYSDVLDTPISYGWVELSRSNN